MKERYIHASRPRHIGMRRMLEQVEENSPGLLQGMASDAFREVYANEGGLRETLHVELGENTVIVRPATVETQMEGRSMKYPVMLRLTFKAASDQYERAPDGLINALSDQLNAAWSAQHADHKPGAFLARTEENGDRTITIAHTDVARLTRIINDVLRQNQVRTMDTRLIGLGNITGAAQGQGR